MATLAALSDGDLLGRMRSGDEDAFTALYRRYQAGIYGFALQMSASASVAEEVAQETFLALVNQPERYDSRRGSLTCYLYGIARNHVLRSLGRDRSNVPIPEESLNGHGPTPGELIVKEDPLQGLARQQRIDRIHQAISALPARYREVVVLCDIQEMSYAQAAAVTGCAMGTVRSRLHRARALLLRKLSETREVERPERYKRARCLT